MKPAFKRSNSQTLDSNLGTNASSSLRRKSTTYSQFQKAHRFRLFVLRFLKKLEMGGQDLRPTVSSLKRPRFPDSDSDSDSDDAVTVLGDTVKRQRTHDSDDGLLAMEDSIRELDDLLHHEGSSSSTTEAYDCWDDDLLGSLIDESELLPDSAVAASAADEAAVVPRLTTHLRHHHHEIEEGPRTTDERELDDEEDLITEFFNHIGGEDDEDPNQDHVHQATEPDHTTLLITIIPFPPSQIIILPVVVGNIGRPRASVLHFLFICLLTIIII
ncbi:hypothetical protein FF1_031897 [Malus domestica]